jgi:integrase
VVDELEQYVPDLPEQDWARVRETVLEVVRRVRPQLSSYTDAALVNAVAHHVDWCVFVAGFDPETSALFRRDVIGAAVAAMPTSRTSSKGRRRSILFRVGEILGCIPVPSLLPTLAGATPTTPYSTAEIDELIRWVDTQRDRDHNSARALIGLGLGAGLPTRDLCAVRALDVFDEGTRIEIPGSKPRIISVADEWCEELDGLVHESEDRTLPLFRPTLARSKNLITVFVARSTSALLRPSSQRMRSTWLVRHLAAGTPMQDLLAMAGLDSMDALVRYERFLPPPSVAARAGKP